MFTFVFYPDILFASVRLLQFLLLPLVRALSKQCHTLCEILELETQASVVLKHMMTQVVNLKFLLLLVQRDWMLVVNFSISAPN